MKSEKILWAMGHISDDLVEAAAINKKRKTPASWLRWAAVAACLCIALAGAICIFQNSNRNQGLALAVEYNGANYAVCGTSGEAAILTACGLPVELTADLAGEFVAYLQFDGVWCYTVSEEETDIVLYRYGPETTENVYILLTDGQYYAAIRRDTVFHGLGGREYQGSGG